MNWLRRSALGALLIMATVSTALAGDDNEAPWITVSGTGSVQAVPDIANVSVSGDAAAATAAKAMSAAADRAGAAIKTALARGIAAKDIRTSQISLAPVYEHKQDQSTPPKITGYRATVGQQLMVREIDTLGALLDALVQTSANRLGGVRFALDDDTEAKDRARKLAVADARHAANVYAAAGVRLGQVISISEGGGQLGRPRALMAMQSAAMPVMPGEISVSAQVDMTFTLLPAN